MHGILSFKLFSIDLLPLSTIGQNLSKPQSLQGGSESIQIILAMNDQQTQQAFPVITMQLRSWKEQVASLGSLIDHVRNEALHAVRELSDAISAEQRKTDGL